VKLICFGDSLTAGSYGGKYLTTLRALRPNDDIVNGGRGGDTVLNLLARLESDVLDQRPDGVFIMIGGNDAISYSQPKTRSYYRNGKGIPDGVVTPDIFASTYRDILVQLHLAGILVWAGCAPVEHNPTVVAAFRQYHALAAEAAASYNVPVLDMLDQFLPDHVPDRPDLDIHTILTIGAREKRGWTDYESARAEGGYTFTFDGLHFMPDAAAQVGRLIADFVDA
jgi:lysophospholipase L1-like esterase